MVFGVFRTKEGKIIAIVIGLIALLGAAFFYKNYKDGHQYSEQAVMAKQYLKTGNYEKAINAYTKALSIRDTDQESLSLGLAEAYMGIHDYEGALKVLRNCYEKILGDRIKGKIEEVAAKKTDYDYKQVISRADIYFSTEEYDKAIIEYEKAKKIKSKEVKSYMRIAQAYMKNGQYDQAKNEAEEGLTLTQSSKLEQIINLTRSHLQKQKYNDMVEEAKEYIYQEQFDDGVKKYLEAARMMPEEASAYKGLAETYLEKEDYKKAIQVLKKALKSVKSDVLKDTMKKAQDLQMTKIQRRSFFSKIYHAAVGVDAKQLVKYMNSKYFTKELVFDEPIYYSKAGDDKPVNGTAMILLNSKSLYAGEIGGGQKAGTGVYFTLKESKGERGYYYYQGKWKKDMPNGNGKTVEETIGIDKSGNRHRIKMVTSGTFAKGLENESMVKQFYTDEVETGNVSYVAHAGIPDPATNTRGTPLFTRNRAYYAIGMLFLGDKATGKYYYIKENTRWGVKPFMK
jgi:tetratricopeptide (TPR) repeat protein